MNGERTHHGMLHVAVNSCLLRIDADLDRIVHTPVRKKKKMDER
jgi:hypothetical protein